MFLMLCVHICLCTMYVPRACRDQQSVETAGTKVTEGCEPPCGYWKFNHHPLETLKH